MLANPVNSLTRGSPEKSPLGCSKTIMLGRGSRDAYRSRKGETTPKSDTKRDDEVKKKVRWLLKKRAVLIQS